MSRPQRKNLTSVTIGPYTPSAQTDGLDGQQGVVATPVNVGISNLYDRRMGFIKKPGWPVCDGDHAACFGRMGQIPLSVYMLDPAMEDIMLQYLRLFHYRSDGTTSRLEMRPDIIDLVQKHRTLRGYRKLKAVSADSGSTNWKLWPEGGGVRYVIRSGQNAVDVTISGSELRQLLMDATNRYSSEQNANVTLADIGINTEISRPENFVIGAIPVLPNTMRIPSGTRFGNRGSDTHPYTEYYAEIAAAAAIGNIESVRNAYLSFIKKGEMNTLKSDVFTSEKTAFIRGRMLAKVGGQIARSVVAPNPDLRPDQIGVPRHLAREISQRLPVTDENMQEVIQLIDSGHVNYVFHTRTKEYIRIDKLSTLTLQPGRMLVLRELTDGDVVLANRQPTLHKNSILAFEVVLHDRDTIEIHPSSTTSFGMDWTICQDPNSRRLYKLQHHLQRKTV